MATGATARAAEAAASKFTFDDQIMMVLAGWRTWVWKARAAERRG